MDHNSTTSTHVLTANRTYEASRNALHSVENSAGSVLISRHTYDVNPITQRESVTTAGSAFIGTPANGNWQYDSLGQVIRADHATNTASNRKYEYDNIGNRTKSASGTSALPISNNWTSNALNQYTVARGITLPTTPAPAPYDLDGNMTAGLIPGGNGSNSGVLPPENATAIRWDAEHARRLVGWADYTECCSARRDFSMLGKNHQHRLISFTIGTVTHSYTYDYLSRLTARLTSNVVNQRYGYDGWNRMVQYDSTTLQDTFTWGLDLSGSIQGAGGVGGLLATRWVIDTISNTSNTDYFPTYDGNGNVSEYIRTDGTIASHYEYDPFGTLTRRTGTPNNRFQYRFSTKPRDTISGLYYYGYRWYDPLTGRWPSRDPLEEEGGVNNYCTLKNNLLDVWDYLGLAAPGVIPSPEQLPKLPIDPVTKLPYKRYLFMGADQSQPGISVDREYVPASLIEEEKKFLQAIEKAANEANYKLVKNTNIGAMMSAWLDESVKDIIVHTHGADEGGGIEISHLWKGGVLNGKTIERDIPIDEVFVPAKGKGKCLSVVCCYRWSNVRAKSDIYSKAGVELNYFFEDVIKDATQDGIVDRQVSRYKILKYLESKKTNQ